MFSRIKVEFGQKCIVVNVGFGHLFSRLGLIYSIAQGRTTHSIYFDNTLNNGNLSPHSACVGIVMEKQWLIETFKRSTYR